VLTVNVAVPLVVPALSVTVWLPEHAGGSTAPAGEAVTLQESAIVPAYAFVEFTVTVDVPEPPGDSVRAVADSVKAALVTVTEDEAVPVALPYSEELLASGV
jgi:hypothetical protein